MKTTVSGITTTIAEQFDQVMEDMIREAIRSEISRLANSGSGDLKQVIHDIVKKHMDDNGFDQLLKLAGGK